MLRQYREIKAGYTDAILFFRLGDFYEMFLDDAKVAARELELTLTGRGKDENRIPMCGIPHHASESYIQKLVSRGYKVAICEQVEEATPAKGLTRRDVVKIVTPGTVLSASGVAEQDNNYLVGVAVLKNGFGLSFLDLSTGEFKVAQSPDRSQLDIQLEQLAPAEVMVDSRSELRFKEGILINQVEFLSPERASDLLRTHFEVASTAAMGVADFQECLPAAWAVLDYANYTQKNGVPHIIRLAPHRFDDAMLMDRTTMQNLELVHSRDSTAKHGTLFSLLNYTKTAMGGRKLKTVIQTPIFNQRRLDARLDGVENLIKDSLTREEIRVILNDVYDIERLTARIVSGTHNPRDCVALRDSLMALRPMAMILEPLDSRLLQRHYRYFLALNDPGSGISKIISLIDLALVDSPPLSAREGAIIRDGYNGMLTQLKASFSEVREWVAGLEDVERNATGIRSLKVGFNKVFGYYIEIPNSNRDKAPEHYIRKQTLANAERFITPELKEKEAVLLNGSERQNALEFELFQQVVRTIAGFTSDLQELASMCAELDCIQSLSTASQKNGYTRPQFVEGHGLHLSIRKGRHPIIEQTLNGGFVSNDVDMSQDKNRFVLLTGPNMAGKSTLMRQVALIVVMAQIGCFVPAESVSLSLVDRLFTRIGAMDNLYLGQSTFMVEMLETASILGNATANSLIILDEIGRGTSTFDGMSLACAISEYIHTEIGARTLFATHYHELTVLEQAYSALSNFTMEITEVDGKLVFTHRYIQGTADKSYGIHVAQMAGLPQPVIAQAQALLDGFEREGVEFLKKKVI